MRPTNAVALNCAPSTEEAPSFGWPGTLFVVLNSLASILFGVGATVSVTSGGRETGTTILFALLAALAGWLAWGVLKHHKVVFWPLVVILALSTATTIPYIFTGDRSGIGALISAAMSGGFLWHFWRNRKLFGAEQIESLQAEKQNLSFASMIAGYIVYLVAGAWGLVLSIQILADAAGLWLVVIGFFLVPAMLALVPWYAGAVDGNWLPLFVIYGGGLLGMILIGMGGRGRN
jgi:biotin transporter BioY